MFQFVLLLAKFRCGIDFVRFCLFAVIAVVHDNASRTCAVCFVCPPFAVHSLDPKFIFDYLHCTWTVQKGRKIQRKQSRQVAGSSGRERIRKYKKLFLATDFCNLHSWLEQQERRGRGSTTWSVFTFDRVHGHSNQFSWRVNSDDRLDTWNSIFGDSLLGLTQESVCECSAVATVQDKLLISMRNLLICHQECAY